MYQVDLSLSFLWIKRIWIKTWPHFVSCDFDEDLTGAVVMDVPHCRVVRNKEFCNFVSKTFYRY